MHEPAGPGSEGREFDVVPGFQNALDVLILAAQGVSRSFAARDESGHLTVFADLRHVDRMLAIAASNAGARDREFLSRGLWALTLARASLQLYLLRVFYDVGATLGHGVDPNAPAATPVALTRRLAPSDAEAAAATTAAIHARLLQVRESIQRLREDRAHSSIARKGFQRVCDETGGYCRRAIGHLNRWLDKRELRRGASDGPDHVNAISDAVLRRLFEAFPTLDDVSADLARFDRTMNDLAGQIMAQFQHELCSIQIVRGDNVVETVAGQGLATQWVGLAKHRLVKEDKLRDIQADIVFRRRLEVIRGHDPRYDRFLFDTFDGGTLVRAFVPLVILRDASGAVREDPPPDCWNFERDPTPPFGKATKKGDPLVLSLRVPRGLSAEVIGTVETGFRFSDAKPTIGLDAAKALAQFVTREAPSVHRHLLGHALERATEQVMLMARGDEAALHFVDRQSRALPQQHFFVARNHEAARTVRPEDRDQYGLLGALPQPDDLGTRAVRRRAYLMLPDPVDGETRKELRGEQGLLASAGVKCVAAFPFAMGSKHGFISVHYKGHVPEFDDLEAAQQLTRRYSDALGITVEQVDARDQLQQAFVLPRVEHPMVARARPTPKSVRVSIAWNALNLFAADVVTLHKYDSKTRRFVPPSEVAGRLKYEEALGGRVNPNDVRWNYVHRTEPTFETTGGAGRDEPGSARRRRKVPFTEREGIVSYAVVPMRVGDRAIGLMFISFRYPHAFSEIEKVMITQFGLVCSEILSRREGRSLRSATRGHKEPVLSAEKARQAAPAAALMQTIRQAEYYYFEGVRDEAEEDFAPDSERAPNDATRDEPN